MKKVRSIFLVFAVFSITLLPINLFGKKYTNTKKSGNSSIQKVSAKKGKVSNKIEHLGMVLEYTIEGDFVFDEGSSDNTIACVPNGVLNIAGSFYNGVTVGKNRKTMFSYPKEINVRKNGFLTGSSEHVDVAHGATHSFNVTFRIPESAKGNTSISFSGLPFYTNSWGKHYAPPGGQLRSKSYRLEISESLKNDDCTPSGVSISDVHGEVYIVPADNPADFYFAEPGNSLCIGDIVETRSNSGALLSLRDMTTYTMSSNTSIRIGDSESNASGIGLLTGHVWANFKRMMQDGSMDIEMSQAVAGIKGTNLFLLENGSTSEVKVVSGSVEVKPKSGRPVMLNAGEAINIRNRQAQGKTKFDIQEQFSKFNSKQQSWIKNDMGTNFVAILGWETHKIGNVSFAIPPNWKHKVFRDGNQRTDIFWLGENLDNPTYGLSIETIDNYNEENVFFNEQGYSNVKISDKTVKQIANNELKYMLFPKIGNSNKGVVFNFISGNKNGFNNMEDIISTIIIN